MGDLLKSHKAAGKENFIKKFVFLIEAVVFVISFK